MDSAALPPFSCADPAPTLDVDPNDAQKSWIFEWGPGGWRAQGMTWHTPGDGWLVAHDVFHHRPTDRGTFAEELASYGAEEWLESRGDPHAVRDQSAEELAQSLCFVLEAAAPGLELGPTPALSGWVPVLSPPRIARLRAGFEEAVSLFYISNHALMTPAQWEQLDAPEYFDRVLDWIHYGWHQAQWRHPDPTRAAADYTKLAELADQVGEKGQVLHVTWSRDAALQVEVQTMPVPRRPRLR